MRRGTSTRLGAAVLLNAAACCSALAIVAGPRCLRRGGRPVLCALDESTLIRQSEVLEILGEVTDPSLVDLTNAKSAGGADVVSLGVVRSVRIQPRGCSLELELPTEAVAAGVTDRLRARCSQLLTDGLPWVESVDLVVSLQPSNNPEDATSYLQQLADSERPPPTGSRDEPPDAAPGVGQVGHIIAVASCKGGVGKSTTTVNLAYALAASGASVGICDLDVHGPSLPTMVQPDAPLRVDGEVLRPLSAHGVKLMSMGFINPGAMPLRGAKVTPVVQQLVGRTAWGALDYLLVDMPPGTGDVQLTLAQDFRVSAAVLVTTPQRLSFVDVVKGVEMFDKVGIPTVAVMENMCGLQLGALQAEAARFGAKHGLSAEAQAELEALLGGLRGDALFGSSHVDKLRAMWGIEAAFSLPLLPELAAAADAGEPLVVTQPDSAPARTYAALAAAVCREVAALGEVARPVCMYSSEERAVLLLRAGGPEQRIDPYELRRKCRSPSNSPDALPDGLMPLDFVPMGNYAVSIRWSDGHQSLIPYASFVDGWGQGRAAA